MASRKVSKMSSWYSDTPDDYYTEPAADVDVLRLASRPVTVDVVPDERMEWMADGACLDVDPEVFFGPLSREAQLTCARCPVIDACFQYSMAHARIAGDGEDHGFAAGLTAPERRRIVERDAA
jgi:hypothetical protein